MQTTTASTLFNRLQTTTLALLILATLASIPIEAATLYWDPNGAAAGTGGDGDWDTTSLFWWNGSTHQAWVDGSVARFEGTAGTVTLKANVSVDGSDRGSGGIRFNTSGYTVDADPGFALTIEDDGSERPFYANNTVNFDAPLHIARNGLAYLEGSNVIINGDVSGAGASTQLAGWSGTLSLNGNNTFAGGIGGYGFTLQLGSATGAGPGIVRWGNFANLRSGVDGLVIANLLGHNNDGNSTFLGTNSMSTTSGYVYYSTVAGSPNTGTRITVSDAVASLTFPSVTEHRWYNTGDFTKRGAGTLVVTGQYSSGGTTRVYEGALILNGPAGNKNSSGGYDPMQGYVVYNAATLGGNGTINLAPLEKVTVNAGGTLSPGASIGTLTVNGDVDLFGELLIEIDSQAAGQQADLLVVNGNLNLTGSSLVVTGDGSVLGEFTLMTVAGGAGSVTGDFASIDYTGLTGLQGVTNLFWEGNNLILSTIPEPASATLLALAGLALLRRRR